MSRCSEMRVSATLTAKVACKCPECGSYSVMNTPIESKTFSASVPGWLQVQDAYCAENQAAKEAKQKAYEAVSNTAERISQQVEQIAKNGDTKDFRVYLNLGEQQCPKCRSIYPWSKGNREFVDSINSSNGAAGCLITLLVMIASAVLIEQTAGNSVWVGLGALVLYFIYLYFAHKAASNNRAEIINSKNQELLQTSDPETYPLFCSSSSQRDRLKETFGDDERVRLLSSYAYRTRDIISYEVERYTDSD